MSTPPAVGDLLGPMTIDRVDPGGLKRLAVLLADPNPIHLDPEAARRAGLGDRVVVQGPASVGYLIDMLLATAPGAELRDLRVRFTANVHGDDRVVAAGRVTEIDEAGGERTLACAVWVDVDGGPRALEGGATLVLRAG